MVSFTRLIVISVLTLFVLRKIRGYLALKHFKGPPLSGWSRFWMLKANPSGRLNEYYSAFNAKYGSTCRIGPGMLVTKDPAIIKRMNAVRSGYNRSEWYQAFRLHPNRDNIATYADGNIHAKLRQAMAPGYSGKENLYLEKDIDIHVLKLCELIQTKYLSSHNNYVPFDLSPTITFFTLDTISTIAFGKCFGFMDKDEDPFGYIEQGKKLWPFLQLTVTYPEIYRLLRLPFIRALWPNSTDAQGLGRVMGFAQEVVAERFGATPVVRKDMLGSFLAHGLSREQLESEALLQITAGSDSTATAIRMMLLHIVTNPRIYATLMRELDSAITADRISRPVIRDQESYRLPYLQACIKESLRLFPPIHGLLAKEVSSPRGDIIDGRFVPQGTQIGWNVWGIMHDTTIFGDDADQFRPERWMVAGADGAKLDKMADTQSLVFGYGKFGCLGRSVASTELNKTVAELLLRFEFEVVNPSKPYDGVCMGFFLQENMFFRVSERKVVRETNGLGVVHEEPHSRAQHDDA